MVSTHLNVENSALTSCPPPPFRLPLPFFGLPPDGPPPAARVSAAASFARCAFSSIRRASTSSGIAVLGSERVAISLRLGADANDVRLNSHSPPTEGRLLEPPSCRGTASAAARAWAKAGYSSSSSSIVLLPAGQGTRGGRAQRATALQYFHGDGSGVSLMSAEPSPATCPATRPGRMSIAVKRPGEQSTGSLLQRKDGHDHGRV